jgi:hypothetical protein
METKERSSEALGSMMALFTGKDLESVGNSKVIVIGGKSIGDDALGRLVLAAGLDHPVFDGPFFDPTVALHRHASPHPGLIFSCPEKNS